MNRQEKTLQDKESLVRGLREKLDWYTFDASEEEYDEKAVESILYLLDRMEPLKEEEVPKLQKSWKQFQKLVKERGEVDLPVEICEGGLDLEEPFQNTEMPEGDTELSAEPGISVDMAALRKNARKSKNGLEGPANNKWRGGERGALRYKYIAVAALLMLGVTVIGNGRAGASPDTGFFHWLRHDSTGIQMMTSPESLDGETDVQGVHMYSDGTKVPQWAQDWLKIDEKFEPPVSYEWERFETERTRNFQKVASYYVEKITKSELILGVIMYNSDITFNTEGLVDYDFIESYKVDTKEMNVYSRKENTGEECFVIYFYDRNCQYFVQGHNNLDEIKGVMEKYWVCVKNKIEKNEIICNKMRSQAIYR